MAGHARFTALLDACVLHPMAVADALMSLAATGIYTAKWTGRIEQEWISSLEERRPDLKGRLDRRRDLMRATAVDWEVPECAWQPLSASLHLPDPNDAHVLAAAIAAPADCIVTTNLRDFPTEVVDPFGIEVIHPDRFLIAQWDLDPVVVMAAFKRMRARWKDPEATVENFAIAMERGGLPTTAQRLREAAALI